MEDFIAFVLGGDGTASILKIERNATTILLGAAHVPGVDPTVPHRLAATCAGSDLRWEVDGVLAGEASDPSPRPGDIALMAGLRAPGEVAVAFDHLAVLRP